MEVETKEPPSATGSNKPVRLQSHPVALAAPETSRVLAVDVGRGFSLFISFIGYPLILALEKTPQSTIGDILIRQMSHSQWDGVTLYDIGWPAYLFGTGVSLALSFARRVERGQSKSAIFSDLIRKFALCLLFAFYFEGGFSVPLKQIRFASLFFFYGFVVLIAGSAQLFLGFRGLLAVVCSLVIGCSAATVWGTYHFFGTIYQRPNANLDLIAEQILGSYLIAQYLWYFPRMLISCLIGLLVGKVLLAPMSPQKRVWYFAGIGWGLLTLSSVLDIWIPINKPLWSTSYALFSSGAASLFLAAFYQLVDVWGIRSLAMPWIVFGTNPLAAWAAFYLIPFDNYAQRVIGYAFEPLLGSYNEVLLAFVRVGLCWLLFYALYRRRVFLRL